VLTAVSTSRGDFIEPMHCYIQYYCSRSKETQHLRRTYFTSMRINVYRGLMIDQLVFTAMVIRT